MEVIERHRTAMRRTGLSRPIQQAYHDGIITVDTSVFDYGCGHGSDVRALSALGVAVRGWDPAHRPNASKSAADVVNLGFVINVIEDRSERLAVVRDAWSFAKGALIVAARTTWDPDANVGRPHRDGRLTGLNTFQKFFEPEELRVFVEQATGERVVQAAPGIVYVFRDPAYAQALLARTTRVARPRLGIAELIYRQHHDSLAPLETHVRENRALPLAGDQDRFAALLATFGSLSAAFAIIRCATSPTEWLDIRNRRVTSQQRYAEHLDDLQPLIDFVSDRGRLPHDGELESESTLRELFGSVRAAFSIVRRVTDPQRWELLTEQATTNFLVYAALAAFGGRPKFGDLPPDLQHDAKDLFGSYKEACDQGDRLLRSIADIAAIDHACKTAPYGKLTPEALYVHVDYLDRLPPLLRVYQGAARQLTGEVEEATILKLHRLKPQVSFLEYPTFDTDPHPPLRASIVARLPELRVSYKSFIDSANPPILHRKETFVPPEHPGHDKYARLTAQEERAGLLNSNQIGTRAGWTATLAAAGHRLIGHRLVRS